MIKLYNIFQDIILEEKRLLTESVSRDSIIDAIDSFYRYRITYQGEREDTPHERFVDFYALGVSKAGNEVVRVFQGLGFTQSNKVGHWKLLRLDRILKISPTGQHVGYKPIHMYGDAGTPPFNEFGDKSMAKTTYIKNNFKK